MATIKINRGTTFSITYNYLENGVPVSLVGATVRFTIKSTESDQDSSDAAAILRKNITTGSAAGIATITIAPSDLVLTPPGNYYYDIKVDKASNGVTVYKTDEGKIKLDGSPTNRLT
jgi:hypothetical protein